MSETLASLPPSPIPDLDAEVDELWLQYNLAREGDRQSRTHIKEAGRRLGLLLAVYRRDCTPGGFLPWLRYHHIPVSTAYKLMKKHAGALAPTEPPPPAGRYSPALSLPPPPPPTPAPLPLINFDGPCGWRGDDFYIAPNPDQNRALDQALPLLAQKEPSFDPVAWFAQAYAQGLPPGLREPIIALWNEPLDHFRKPGNGPRLSLGNHHAASAR